MTTRIPGHPALAPTAVPDFLLQARRIGRTVWFALHALGAARARRELVRLADSYAVSNPGLAAHLRQVVREDWLSQS